MPHERDQGPGQVARAPDPVIQQASKDLEASLVDTDMRATPGLDAANRARMVSTPPPDKGVGSDPQRATARADRRGPTRGHRYDIRPVAQEPRHRIWRATPVRALRPRPRAQGAGPVGQPYS